MAITGTRFTSVDELFNTKKSDPLFLTGETADINYYFGSAYDYVYDSFVTDLNNIRNALSEIKVDENAKMKEQEDQKDEGPKSDKEKHDLEPNKTVSTAKELFFNLIQALESCPERSQKLSKEKLAKNDGAKAILNAAKAFQNHMSSTPPFITKQESAYEFEQETHPLRKSNINQHLQWEEIKKWTNRIFTVVAFIFGGGLVAGALLATKMGVLGYVVGGPIGGIPGGAVAFKKPSIHDYVYDRFFKGQPKSIAKVGISATQRVVANIPEEKKDAPPFSPKPTK